MERKFMRSNRRMIFGEHIIKVTSLLHRLISVANNYQRIFVVFVLLPVTFTVHAESAAPGYTAEQAAAGKLAYDKNCASCHGQTLSDGEFAPPLKGDYFIQSWGG